MSGLTVLLLAVDLPCSVAAGSFWGRSKNYWCWLAGTSTGDKSSAGSYPSYVFLWARTKEVNFPYVVCTLPSTNIKTVCGGKRLASRLAE